MADKNPIEQDYAVRIHRAEYEVGKALQSGNVDRVNRAYLDLTKAETELQTCLDGRAYSVPVER